MPRLSAAQLEARRVEILQAALRCFAKRGFGAATMEEIAVEAGVAVGTLYSYFMNKRDLIAALSRLNRERTKAHISRFVAMSDPLEAINQLVESSLEAMLAPEAELNLRIELHLWASAVTDEQLGRWLRKQVKLWEESLVGMIERGQASGLIDLSLEPRVTAHTIFALLNGLCLLRVLAPGTKRDRAKRNAEVMESVRRLLAGLGGDRISAAAATGPMEEKS